MNLSPGQRALLQDIADGKVICSSWGDYYSTAPERLRSESITRRCKPLVRRGLIAEPHLKGFGDPVVVALTELGRQTLARGHLDLRRRKRTL